MSPCRARISARLAARRAARSGSRRWRRSCKSTARRKPRRISRRLLEHRVGPAAIYRERLVHETQGGLELEDTHPAVPILVAGQPLVEAYAELGEIRLSRRKQWTGMESEVSQPRARSARGRSWSSRGGTQGGAREDEPLDVEGQHIGVVAVGQGGRGAVRAARRAGVRACSGRIASSASRNWILSPRARSDPSVAGGAYVAPPLARHAGFGGPPPSGGPRPRGIVGRAVVDDDASQSAIDWARTLPTAWAR